MTPFDDRWKAVLDDRKQRGRLRNLPGSRLPVRADFSSNDYLGLRTRRELVHAGAAAAAEAGAGSGASRLIAGNYPLLETLESSLADWLEVESVLYFSTGWQMNVSVLQALAGRGDTIVIDRLAHNSLVRGALGSGASVVRFAHNDANDAAEKLQKATGRRMLVTESLFSMDGDLAPLAELAGAARATGALFVVDEAHAAGVAGPQGRGYAAALGLQPDVLLGTCGKAFGTQGGFVAGSHLLTSFLVNVCEGLIYSTAPVPFAAGATLEALRIIRQEEYLRTRLQERTRLMASLLNREPGTSTQIIPVTVGSESALARIRETLEPAGFYAGFIRPPTVPENTCRLRISLSAAHSEDAIREFAAMLSRLTGGLEC